MGVNNLPETVTRQRRVCDLNPGPSVPESSTLTTRLPSHCKYRTKDPNAYCNRVSLSSASIDPKAGIELAVRMPVVAAAFSAIATIKLAVRMPVVAASLLLLQLYN